MKIVRPYSPKVFQVTPKTFCSTIEFALKEHKAVVVTGKFLDEMFVLNDEVGPTRLFCQELMPQIILNRQEPKYFDFSLGVFDDFSGEKEEYAYWGKRIDEACGALQSPFDVFIFDRCYLFMFFPMGEKADKRFIRSRILKMWKLIDEKGREGKKFVFATKIHPLGSYWNGYEIPIDSRMFFTAPICEFPFQFIEYIPAWFG